MQRAVVVGGGVGGLSAACQLALDGFDVQVFEAADTLGGKMARRSLAGRAVDIGPSVLTLAEVFEGLFARAGESLSDHLHITKLPELATHVWAGREGARRQELVLYHDVARSADAVDAAFGKQARDGYLAYTAYCERLWDVAKDHFVFGPKLNPAQVLLAYGTLAFRALRTIDAGRSMQAVLREYFPATPALRQLFGRYATYAGSSPVTAPATLHLISHVERMGSWQIEGGMSALAQALVGLASRLGVTMHTNAPVRRVLVRGGAAQGVRLLGGEDVMTDTVLLNTDASLSPDGQLWFDEGPARHRRVPTGLSAWTSSMVADIDGLPDSVHTMLFADEDEQAEYRAIFDEGRMPDRSNVYLFSPDRGPLAHKPNENQQGGERLFCVVNAPPTPGPSPDEDHQQWNEHLLRHLASVGINVKPRVPPYVQSPSTFEQRFPHSGGVLYGQQAAHWRDFFRRPGSRTKIRHCLRVGGGVHPGAGVPMAALSGLFAAETALRDSTSTSRFRLAAMLGGTSTQRATTARLK